MTAFPVQCGRPGAFPTPASTARGTAGAGTTMFDTVFTMETVPLKLGWGSSAETGAELRALGVQRVMALTDPHVGAQPFAQSLFEDIRRQGVDLAVFDQVHAEPTDASWAEAVAFAADSDFGAFVALGGGSTIDTAKAANLYSTYPAPLLTYINKPVGDALPAPGPLKPLVAIPTTAGTGSEITPVAVVDLLEHRLKTGVAHRFLRPHLAIIDPALSVSMPAAVTASAGIDVLCHALESYLSLPFDRRPRPETPTERPPYVGANPISDIWCEAAIQRVAGFLVRACESPGDREARTELMYAATFAGMGFGNAGVHIPHAMAYPLAGLVRGYVHPGYPGAEVMVPHGVSVALGAPAAFRFIGNPQPQKTAKALALLGVDSAPDENAMEVLAGVLCDLMRRLGLPNGLAALGYGEADVERLAEGAFAQQRLLAVSPRPVSLGDLQSLFRDSMSLW